MSINYLIPFVPLKGHKDPDFRMPVYGDSGQRGENLQRTVSTGSYLFFHTSLGSSKYITGYICVAKIVPGVMARKDLSFCYDAQYDDWCFIGDPQRSKRLRKPLLFNKRIAEQLSLGIDFSDFANGRRTELQVIASATRPHRKLTDSDVAFLINEIEKLEANEKTENDADVQKYIYFYDECQDAIPFDEVHQIKELEIQKLLRKDPGLLGANLRVLDYEKVMPDGDRLDLLLEDTQDHSLIIAELKAPGKAGDDLPTQVSSYARDIEKEYPNRTVKKMIVCDGNVSPKLRKACENLGITLIAYGFRLTCLKLSL